MTRRKKRRRGSHCEYMSKVAAPKDHDAHDGTERPIAVDAWPQSRAECMCSRSDPDIRIEHDLPADVMREVERADPSDLLDSPLFGAFSDERAGLMPFGHLSLPWLHHGDKIREWRRAHARRLADLERDATGRS